MKTLLVITPSSKIMHDCVFDLFVAETGEHLASHFCSHAGFAMGDLYSSRPERREKWREKFGEVEVKFIDQIDITEDELVKRNHNFYKAGFSKPV